MKNTRTIGTVIGIKDYQLVLTKRFGLYMTFSSMWGNWREKYQISDNYHKNVKAKAFHIWWFFSRLDVFDDPQFKDYCFTFTILNFQIGIKFNFIKPYESTK